MNHAYMPRFQSPAATDQSMMVPIIGQSEATQTLRSLIDLIAHSSSTALVTGESGTGKELVAQALHASGPRALARFVPINCGAIPRELIESELFGHRKGAFTGALNNRQGRFELAHGGTLFLDEIGDLPMDMQVKLLRALQERRILPVGADSEVDVDVRVVAATHKDLEEEVRAGRFREDLYYRINVLPIRTTPLRERPADISELLTFYARRHVRDGGRAVSFAADMLSMLCEYEWPGNVRELSNLVDRFSTLFTGQCIDIGTVPAPMLPVGLARMQKERLGHAVAVAALPARRADDQLALAALGVMAPEIDAASMPAPVVEAMAAEVRSAVPPRSAQPYAATIVAQDHASNDEPNPVEQAILLAQGVQTLPEEGISLKQHLVSIERSLIEQALERSRGNVSQTAKLLQLQRTTLIEKINKYGMRVAAEG